MRIYVNFMSFCGILARLPQIRPHRTLPAAPRLVSRRRELVFYAHFLPAHGRHCNRSRGQSRFSRRSWREWDCPPPWAARAFPTTSFPTTTRDRQKPDDRVSAHFAPRQPAGNDLTSRRSTLHVPSATAQIGVRRISRIAMNTALANRPFDRPSCWPCIH